jgi:hypothetical protein
MSDHMKKIQRYDFTEIYKGMDSWHVMKKEDDGEYVLYDDIITALTDMITYSQGKALLADKLLIALADAIRRPMGVVPDSAKGLVTDADLAAAEKRRAAEGAEKT